MGTAENLRFDTALLSIPDYNLLLKQHPYRGPRISAMSTVLGGRDQGPQQKFFAPLGQYSFSAEGHLSINRWYRAY
jgi:hypothetical protein